MALLIVGLLAGVLGIGAALVALFNWYRIVQLAPMGERLQAAIDLGSLNYPGLESRIGAAAAGPLSRFRQAIGLFILCVGTVVVLTVVNIASGTAA